MFCPVQMVHFYEWYRRMHKTPEASAYGEEEEGGSWVIDVAPGFSMAILHHYMIDTFIDAGIDDKTNETVANNENEDTETLSCHPVSIFAIIL